MRKCIVAIFLLFTNVDNSQGNAFVVISMQNEEKLNFLMFCNEISITLLAMNFY